MQNHDSHSFKRFWKDKGYYILLGLCVLAVCVSGYFFISGALKETNEAQEVLSIPTTVEEPAEKPAQTPAKTDTPAQQKEQQPAEETAAKQPAEETVTPAEPMVVLPVNGDVLQNHAMDRLVYHATTQDWRVHNGVDLAAEVGEPVKAARAGTVSAVYEDDFYGMTVVITHGDYTAHYCNLALNPMVAAGDPVAAGTVIGVVGNTALLESASASHLHFEVFRGGEPVDPASFLY